MRVYTQTWSSVCYWSQTVTVPDDDPRTVDDIRLLMDSGEVETELDDEIGNDDGQMRVHHELDHPLPPEGHIHARVSALVDAFLHHPHRQLLGEVSL